MSRFPLHELAIHRLYRYDMAFRTICVDYADACCAVQHWQFGPTPSARNVRQYRQILKELEAELLDMIEASLSFCQRQNRMEKERGQEVKPSLPGVRGISLLDGSRTRQRKASSQADGLSGPDRPQARISVVSPAQTRNGGRSRSNGR